MSPFSHGRIVPEIESTGRAKHLLDVLLWLPKVSVSDVTVLRDVSILKDYLASLQPFVCDVSFKTPASFSGIAALLERFGVPCSIVPIENPNESLLTKFKGDLPPGLLDACATALANDCDVIVCKESDWFPYWAELRSTNLLAVNPDILKRQCEIFARGHDVPWSFDAMTWNKPWTGFYMMSEHRTFHLGLRFLNHCYKAKLNTEAQELGRMLIYNRLPGLCFTRDRLLFYEQQQAAAKRAQWGHQQFLFEVGYHLEYYYLLIFGGLDSLALTVNYALNIGLPDHKVAAQSKAFLEALEKKAPSVHAVFIDGRFSDFLNTITGLRHFAAHRGSIMPGKVYEKPEIELSDAQLDAEITKQGLDDTVTMFPAGPLREFVRSTLRHRLRLESMKEVLNDVVLVKRKQEYAFVHPLVDVEWNFDKFCQFMDRVLQACESLISATSDAMSQSDLPRHHV